MAYVKITWAADTPITSDLLNHLETQYGAAVDDVDNHTHDADHYTETEMNSTFWHAGNDGSGSGCDADTVEGNEAAYFDGVGAPTGLIIMFSGAVPSGWYLCDGNNGTLDLRNLFIVGAGSTYDVGDTGGGASITPTATVTVASHVLTLTEIPAHTHGYTDKYNQYGKAQILYYNTRYLKYVDNSGNTTGSAGGGQGHGHAGSTWTGESQENRPPYYALKYIQKG